MSLKVVCSRLLSQPNYPRIFSNSGFAGSASCVWQDSCSTTVVCSDAQSLQHGETVLLAIIFAHLDAQSLVD